MPARSKFTAKRREVMIEALRRRDNRRVAGALAGVDHRQIGAARPIHLTNVVVPRELLWRSGG
jgi:hypothetical protein